jgi:hypothetical protein
VAAFMAIGVGQAQAAHCTITLTNASSIQAAIDAASFGDVVCLDNSGGVFAQTVVFGPEDSGITLSAAHSASPELDGTSTGFPEAIRFLDGVTDVTIENLDIHDYTGVSCCGVGNAIQAWAVNTSTITIRNNYMHDNNYSAILVGSEGTQNHSGWAVHGNTATDNATSFFSAQIELTNCNGCSIHRNVVDGGAIGILVQARNTVPDSGLIEIKGVSVKRNQVGDTAAPGIGVYLLALASQPVPPFDPIDAAQSELHSVSVGSNTITSPLGAHVLGFLDGDIINPALVRNDFVCSGGTGIWLREIVGEVINAKVVNNDFDASCTTLTDEGDETKFPPVPDNPS